jgi:adenylate cyclase
VTSPNSRLRRYRPHAFLIALLIGLTGALLTVSPWGQGLEEHFGLSGLFHLRGARTAPDDVVVVSIDRRSAAALGAPDEPELWPHRLHAELIRKLSDAGAALIAFNVFFGATQSPEEDGALAEAIQRAGNVVLASYLKPRDINESVYAESVLQPIPPLADAALATAPFLLPKQSSGVKRFVTFNSAGDDAATLPATLLHLFVLARAPDELFAVLRLREPSAAEYLAEHGSDNPGHRLDVVKLALAASFDDAASVKSVLAAARSLSLSPQRISLVAALLNLYGHRSAHYFDHYGPAGTVTTIPYHEVLEHSEKHQAGLKGRVVFVGFSADLRPESTEGVFDSVFATISSVELAASAFANLLENRSIRPAPLLAQFIGLLLWGCLVGWVGQVGRLRDALLGIAAMQAIYLVLCSWVFARHSWWLPWLTPLVFQGGISMLASWAGHYREHGRERLRMQEVVQRFVPVEVVSQLAARRSCDEIVRYGRLTYGACLATDAGSYATLAESMDPMALGDLMNEYYGTIFRPIREQGGWVSDVIGDAMLAIWTEPADEIELKRRALAAALSVRALALRFEQSRRIHLPIRIGVHSGDMRIGYVGASDHGEFRAVGDTVNTAARIEALNKLLGTRILISEAAVEGLDSCFSARRLGSFQLAGKNRPVTVYELMEAEAHGVDVRTARFTHALDLFDSGRWQDALAGFQSLLQDFPDDGPSLFYVGLCRKFLTSPSEADHDRIIRTVKPEGARRV